MPYRWQRQGYNWVKDKADKLNRGIPALMKVTNMAGTAAFNADKFYAWTFGIASGWDHPLGLIDAGISVIGVAGETTIGRFFSIYNPPLNHAAYSPDDPRAIAARATLWNPGMPTSCSKTIAYRFLFMLPMALFMLNSGMGSYQNQYSLEQLIARIPGLEMNGACDANHSPYGQIITAQLFAVYAGYCAIRSFQRSNLVRLRQYYVQHILQGGWRNIGYNSYLVAAVMTCLYANNIAFNNQHTWETLQKNALCHLPIPAVPNSVVIGHTIEAASVTFMTTLYSSIPAIHKRNTQTSHRELSDLLRQVPTCQRWHRLFQLFFLITAYNAARGTFISIVRLTNPSMPVYLWWLIFALAVIATRFAFKNQLALSYEAYLQQLEYWAVQNQLLSQPLSMEEQLAQAAKYQQLREPLLVNNAQIEKERDEKMDLREIHVVNPAADVAVPTVDMLQADSLVSSAPATISSAPASTLFGTINPMNLQRQVNTSTNVTYAPLGSP